MSVLIISRTSSWPEKDQGHLDVSPQSCWRRKVISHAIHEASVKAGYPRESSQALFAA
jgi:hypothetical protein